MMQIEALTDLVNIGQLLDPIALHYNWDYSAYIQRIKKDGWTLDEVKPHILDGMYYSSNYYIDTVLDYKHFESENNGARMLKWLSRAVAYNLFDTNVIREFSRSENVKDWIGMTRKAIRNVKSFDDLAKLYMDNKLHEPLISAYVTYAIGRRQK